MTEAKNEIWNNVTTDPTTGITLMSIDGIILYINTQSVRIFFNTDLDPSEYVGKSLYELDFSDDWARERIELFEKIQATGEPVLIRTIWHGKQQFSWMSLIPGEDDGEADRVMVITRRIAAGDEANHFLEGDHEVFNSKVIRLGELQKLTPRELEILALIGQGMTIKEIAAALFRSVKTIENHRESIGRKLHKTRGVELAYIAHSAGLRVEDATRIREGTDAASAK
ncbi:MAG: LuxR C-terminal-related transcriptional regulator [Phycisphaerales bacterium]